MFTHNASAQGTLSGGFSTSIARKSSGSQLAQQPKPVAAKRRARAGLFSSSFFRGAKAGIPVFIAFIPSSIAMGIAANVQGLSLGEITLMSALVHAGPAQFAVLGPLVTGQSVLQILLITLLVNLRLSVMSAAIAPHFQGTKRSHLLWGAHFLGAGTFIVPYAHFEKEASADKSKRAAAARSRRNFHYFLGMGIITAVIWVAGTVFGYMTALRIPAGFDEVMRFILPGYFACLLAVDLKTPAARLVGTVGFIMAALGMTLNADWGWVISALLVSTAGWSFERWTQRDSA